ncbi:TPA: 5-formyltetrahydrofolate cyclo-ligase [Streptococcus suis]
MDKHAIRRRSLEELKRLSPEEREVWSKRVLDRLCALPSYQEASILATYLSLPHECGTSYLIERATADGKTIVIPKTYSQGRMIFVEYKADDLEETKFGTLEPRSDVEIPAEQIDLMHVPGLAWNADGYRIGYGGGYYDRYLAGYQGATVSTLLKSQLIDFQPDDFDKPVKEMISIESVHQ